MQCPQGYVALMEQGRAMTTNLKQRLACGLAASVLAVGAWWHNGVAGQAPQTPPAAQIVAEVNGVPITRQELAEELISRYGRKQLKLYINRRIIEQECAKHGITVTEQEVENELREKMQMSGSVSYSDFEKQMLQPRKMNLYEYRTDVLRPGMLMRRLAGSRIQVSEDELRKAYTARYGEKVQCRLIVERNHNAAMQMHAQIAGKRDKFIEIARQQADPQFARVAGLINPIGRYTTHDIIERRAFELKDDEVSEVIQAPEGGYVILYREKLLPADTSRSFEMEKENLRQQLVEEKAQKEIPVLFQRLEKQAKVRDYLNDNFNIPEYSAEQMRKGTP